MSEPVMCNINVICGHIQLEFRQIWDAEGCDMQGRALHYDRDRNLIKTTPWETTCRLSFSGPAPNPWWRFWA